MVVGARARLTDIGPGTILRDAGLGCLRRIHSDADVRVIGEEGPHTEEERRQLELMLVADPRLGQVMERTGGFRKMRFARPSRREGKRGGTRVIYYFVQRKDRIYLIEVYPKSVKDDLTRAEENALRELARVLEGDK